MRVKNCRSFTQFYICKAADTKSWTEEAKCRIFTSSRTKCMGATGLGTFIHVQFNGHLLIAIEMSAIPMQCVEGTETFRVCRRTCMHRQNCWLAKTALHNYLSTHGPVKTKKKKNPKDDTGCKPNRGATASIAKPWCSGPLHVAATVRF